MYFVQLFDARPDVDRDQMVDIYKRLAVGWQKAWPSNRLHHLFVRKWDFGAEPSFMAFWELPNAAALDEWETTWPQVREAMEPLENEFWGAVANLETKLMDKVLSATAWREGTEEPVRQKERAVYYVQLFNPKPGISNEEIVAKYRRNAIPWEEAHPSNRFHGLFLRKLGLGAEPVFITVWEMPDAAAFDPWDTMWEINKAKLEEPEKDLGASITGVESKMMEKVAP